MASAFSGSTAGVAAFRGEYRVGTGIGAGQRAIFPKIQLVRKSTSRSRQTVRKFGISWLGDLLVAVIAWLRLHWGILKYTKFLFVGLTLVMLSLGANRVEAQQARIACQNQFGIVTIRTGQCMVGEELVKVMD
ncbi:MAG: hypothetical protein KJ040_05300 [Gammaproteobacteria bacterium]|nr:hypothetical protein [Gammaproteobacteria bacterium]